VILDFSAFYSKAVRSFYYR